MAKKTRTEFITDAIRVHGNRYDYSHVEYINGKSKVEIICSFHNSFLQTPESHLSGNGCPLCANELRGNKLRSSANRFIERATAVHGSIFDYSDIKYIDNKTNVRIVCKKHGVYFQNPLVHIKSKFGCPQCAFEYTTSLKRLTLENFIDKSTKTHKGVYDYSQVEYINNTTPVKIVCSVHSVFLQSPASHMKGFGCKKCRGMGLSTDEYLEKAKIRHGDKYDYSTTIYHGIKKPIQYICPTHGVVTQTAEGHLSGGCGLCANNLSITESDFLKLAREKHGSKFDYSKMEYYNYKNRPISISCPDHGLFFMTPFNHIRSQQGCPKCAYRHMGDHKRVTKEGFVLRSSTIHNHKYDYSLVNDDMKLEDEVTIVCPIHGCFNIKADWHLNTKVGCAKCVGRGKTTDEYIEEARAIHGDKYNYSKVYFRRAIDKVEIVCPKHGSFKQQANLHLMGAGCPKCSMSRMENKVMRALEKRGVRYEYQKTFGWLKYKGHQFLDLFLPDFNIAIECQGTQHFVPTKRTGGYLFFAERCIMDKNKYNLCKDHGIQILYYCTKSDYLPDEYLDTIYSSINALMSKIILTNEETFLG